MRNIILTGFMGTGKTTVARILEERLKMRFVDTDRMIEDMAGAKINDIFKNKGEPHFRELEAEVIGMVSKEENQIISTGGGAVLSEENLSALKGAGRLITLTASPDTICKRVSGSMQRPLLNDKDLIEEIDKLLKVRMKHYNKSDLMIDTDALTPDEVADEIEEYIIRSGSEVIRVELGDRSYNIKIGSGILKDAGAELVSLGFTDRAVIITNKRIDALYGEDVVSSLKKAGINVDTIFVDEGESSKSLTVANDIITKLLEFKCERSTPLIALGGGVIGDLTGFVASIYLRGVPFVQIPTTLLAQVDSSVGGKTGVNHARGKNLIGSFYQPETVIIDMDVLRSLEHDEFLNGIAEIIKYGVIKDAELFDYLKDNADAILKKDDSSLDHLIHIIKRSCEIKALVVSEDEKESGLRAILNFGHTLAHALEANASYKGIKHGRAVAIGMIFAAKVSASTGCSDMRVHDEIEKLLKSYGIDTDIAIEDKQQIVDTMKLDKKVKQGNIKFVLPSEIGSVDFDINISEADLMELL